ncbi:MAG: hypothetical protein A2Z20_00360 [Bdellovibrionales bacterium RBG_16_40_8]|nr:MAG: hypothetical protein A2Z20_00360 [Bdellovibrionales bacterium RBG_16_40_8]
MEKWKKIKCLALDVDGVLTDGSIFMGPDNNWYRNFYIRDGLGLVMLKEHGFKIAFITTSKSPDIAARAKNLQVDYCYDGCKNKAEAFYDLMNKTSFGPDEILFVGDDVIDLPVFEICKFTAAPSDAHVSVKARATLVTLTPGGRGAVREICDALIEHCLTR